MLTNPGKTTLYVGMTNDLSRRLAEHFENRGNPKSFAGRYYCYQLIYYEVYQYVFDAIDREKQIKKWSHKKKEQLIETENPKWENLNPEFYIPEE